MTQPSYIHWYCGKTFTRASSLRVHMRVHSEAALGMKPPAATGASSSPLATEGSPAAVGASLSPFSTPAAATGLSPGASEECSHEYCEQDAIFGSYCLIHAMKW